FAFGSATFFQSSISVLTQIFTPDNSSSTVPSLQYTYDSQHRVKQVSDGVTLAQGASVRPPYQFYLGDGVRAERQDPVGNIYT
ncbi:hypothetical protein ABTN15_19920, partial [Acinetobacter baumannii]